MPMEFMILETLNSDLNIFSKGFCNKNKYLSA